jgi:signal transduction histidine kinase
MAASDRPPLSAALDSAAYRILRESLTNAIRHAHATLATISIRYESTGVCIEVADNGVGADAGIDSREPEQRGRGGHGLVGMSERAAALGGWLRAGSGPSGGFLVQAWLPTSADVAEGGAP